jgi:hypothetical protein
MNIEATPCSPELIMLRPKHFGWNSETASSNAIQGTGPSPTEAGEIAVQGLHEFDQMADALHRAGIPLTILEDRDDPVCPDAVFLNNLFCTLPSCPKLPDGQYSDNETSPTAGGGAGLVHFSMESPTRRLEIRPNLAHELIEAGFQVDFESDWSAWAEGGQFLEGTGSMVLDHPNRVAYAALSSRTSATLFSKWCSTFGYQPFAFATQDQRRIPYYHTNVMMSLGRKLALVGEECLDQITWFEIRRQLADSGREIIGLHSVQVSNFAANVLEACSSDGSPHWIASERALKSWTAEQRRIVESHGNLIPVKIPTIERIGGGSARCMLAENHLLRRIST